MYVFSIFIGICNFKGKLDIFNFLNNKNDLLFEEYDKIKNYNDNYIFFCSRLNG